MNQKSIFAASQRAAKMVEQDRPVLEFAQSEDERIIAELVRKGFSDKTIQDTMSAYRLINVIRKQLGMVK